jgi:hypothetical protein
MGQAWPRFLPGSPAEAIAHALMIEARVILVEQLGEGQRDLIEAHQRAMSYARGRYRPDEIRTAWNACATATGNSNILLHYLTTFAPAVDEGSEQNRLAA